MTDLPWARTPTFLGTEPKLESKPTMTTLQKILTSHFGDLSVEVVQPDAGEPGVTRKQLGEMLGYEYPVQSITKIHERNQDRLDPLSVVVKMTTTDGKAYDTYLYGFKGVLELCRFSDMPNAHAVIDWAWDTLDGLRRGTITGTPNIGVQQLESRLEIAELKLQMFEEHCPAKFYDFDEVAALMQFYVKPPFGRNHLKRWMIDRKILCVRAFKNDKPQQVYLDRGWFVAVIHEWFRRGRKHTENRFYMTPRGVMGVVDIAIREKLMTLPAPKHACLPGLYSEPLNPQAGGPITVADYNGVEQTIL